MRKSGLQWAPCPLTTDAPTWYQGVGPRHKDSGSLSPGVEGSYQMSWNLGRFLRTLTTKRMARLCPGIQQITRDQQERPKDGKLARAIGLGTKEKSRGT